MYKKTISLLITIMVLFTCSIATFAESITSSEESIQITDNYDEVIISRGSILTYEDFAELKAELNESTTDEDAKKMIVEKIEEKEELSGSNITASYTIWGMNLNADELALVVLYPVYAVYVYNDAQTALTEAQNRYQSSTLYLGNGDAFRHAYWNALMVNDCGVLLAEAFAYAHESETPEGVDKEMDLYNNEQGRYIGQYASPSTYITAVTNYVSWGWLKRVVNSQLVATDSSGRL